MANRGIRDLIYAISPSWLRGPTAARFVYSFTLGMDLLLEKLEEAMLAHMPGRQEDASALALQAADRLFDRGISEGDAVFAARMRLAFDAWAHAGSALAQLQQLLAYIFPASLGIRLISNTTLGGTPLSVWYTLEAGATSRDVPRVDFVSPANWDWDGVYGAEWWRTWIVIYIPPSLWTAEATWGTGVWGDGGVWGLTATPQQAATLRAIVKKWKAKHSWCQWIILSLSTGFFDPYQSSVVNPDGTWAHWSKYSAGLQSASRIDAARYVDGTPYQIVQGGAGSVIQTVGA